MSEELLARHRKERKDLIATITGMKKQANKKNKKQVMKKCAEMEESLNKRHIEELNAEKGGNKSDAEDTDDDVSSEDEDSEDDEFSPEKLLAQLELEKKVDSEPAKSEVKKEDNSQEQRPKKKNKQKERIAKREAMKEKMKEEALKEAEGQVDLRAIELENLNQLCQRYKLVQHDIRPDGNCLFASIIDQLEQRHNVKGLTVGELRQKACDYMLNNRSRFEPFLFNETTMQMDSIEEYCEKMKKNAEWGGDMEILALANVFDCPISVLISGAATHKVNESGSEPELKLVYYKHIYGLGEHYNSLRDAQN